MLPDSAKISTGGSSLIKNLFGGGSTTPGQPGQPGQPGATGGGISTTLIIGGVAVAGLIAFLIFKKK